MRIHAPLFDSRWNRITRIACILVVIVACLVLTGWLLDIELFKSLAPGLVAMNPMTAIAFILSAASLWLVSDPEARSDSRRWSRYLALAVLLIACLKLADILLGTYIHIDRLLFTEKLDMVSGPQANRMAPNTSLNFFLFGAALWFLDWPRSRWVSLWFALSVWGFSLLALVGYIYGMNSFYSVASYIPMALHTAAAFFVLTLGLFTARPQSPLFGVIASDTVAGITAQRLLPVVIIAPILLGWLILSGHSSGLYPWETTIALFTVGVVLIFQIVVWLTVRTLFRIETARHAADEKIHQLNQELIAANKELEAFSYSVSHDLRAPLRAINGFSRILMNDYSDEIPPEAVRLLGVVNANAGQMGRLIDDLLAFSRLSRQAMKRQTIALSPLVTKVFMEVNDADSGPEIDFIVGELPPVEADPALIKQVFVNLLSNAIKYSSKREHPCIEVGAEQRDGKTVYFVKDNGVGFDMKYADKLFTVFQRLHRAEEFEGTGVGLATAQRIIHRHGGRLWADAALDQGATFYFTLGEE